MRVLMAVTPSETLRTPPVHIHRRREATHSYEIVNQMFSISELRWHSGFLLSRILWRLGNVCMYCTSWQLLTALHAPIIRLANQVHALEKMSFVKWTLRLGNVLYIPRTSYTFHADITRLTNQVYCCEIPFVRWNVRLINCLIHRSMRYQITWSAAEIIRMKENHWQWFLPMKDHRCRFMHAAAVKLIILLIK